MKTEDRSSALQYAKALMQLAQTKGSEEDVYKDLETVSRTFQEQPEFSLLFRHPAIPAPEKKRFISEFSENLDKLAGSLLFLLCERRKMQLLPLIVDEFNKLIRAKHNIISGTLISAEPMTDAEVSLIKGKLIQKLKKHVELLLETDSSLIGGCVLRLGDQVIDGSLKGRLKSIEKTLLSC